MLRNRPRGSAPPLKRLRQPDKEHANQDRRDQLDHHELGDLQVERLDRAIDQCALRFRFENRLFQLERLRNLDVPVRAFGVRNCGK